MAKRLALVVFLLLGVVHGNPQSAEGYLMEKYGQLSEATIAEFQSVNGRYVAANVTTNRTFETIVVLEAPDGVQTVLRLDQAVYEFDGISHHNDAYRRNFTDLELIDSNGGGIPELLLVSGCECAPAVAYSIIVDLGTFDALSFGVLAWYDELPSGEYRDYTPLIETLDLSSDRLAAMQAALIEHLQNTRFPATLNPNEAYPSDSIVPVQIGRIRPSEPTQRDVNNVCARLGVATVSDKYRLLSEVAYLDVFDLIQTASDMCQPQLVLQAVKGATQELHRISENLDDADNVLEPLVQAAELQDALEHYFHSLISHPDLQADPTWLEAFVFLPYEREGSDILNRLQAMADNLLEDQVRFAQDWYIGQSQCSSEDYTARPSWCSLAFKHGIFNLDH